MAQCDLKKEVLTLYAGDSGKYDCSRHYYKGCAAIREIAPRILDNTELRVIRLRLHSSFNTSGNFQSRLESDRSM